MVKWSRDNLEKIYICRKITNIVKVSERSLERLRIWTTWLCNILIGYLWSTLKKLRLNRNSPFVKSKKHTQANRRCNWYLLKCYNSVFIPKPVDHVETCCVGTSLNDGFSKRICNYVTAEASRGVSLISLSQQRNHSQLLRVAFAVSPPLCNWEQCRFWAKRGEDNRRKKKRSLWQL